MAAHSGVFNISKKCQKWIIVIQTAIVKLGYVGVSSSGAFGPIFLRKSAQNPRPSASEASQGIVCSHCTRSLFPLRNKTCTCAAAYFDRPFWSFGGFWGFYFLFFGFLAKNTSRARVLGAFLKNFRESLWPVSFSKSSRAKSLPEAPKKPTTQFAYRVFPKWNPLLNNLARVL